MAKLPSSALSGTPFSLCSFINKASKCQDPPEQNQLTVLLKTILKEAR